MRIGVVGINHKIASLDLRERLAKACHKHFSPDNPFQEDHRFLLLSTCNRTEVYFSSEDLAASHSHLLSILRKEVHLDFEHKLYSYFGQDCFSHLARVTAGIDSAIAGETEIQGQVKNAYESRCRYGSLPYDLHFLFQKALKIGKHIRTQFQLGRGLPDIEHVILSTGLQSFGEDLWSLPTLFVGASEINQKICTFLKQRGMKNLTMANRTDERAKTFANRHEINTLKWNNLETWANYKWVIVGTKAPENILYPLPKRRCYPSLIIDLSVPRNVDPKVGKQKNVALYNIDQINRNVHHRELQLRDKLQLAEIYVADQVSRLTKSFKGSRKKKEQWLQILAKSQ